MTRRVSYKIEGVVQGVGFRPFVYRKASEFGLTGFVRNSGNSVYAEIQGSHDQIALFERALNDPPPQARITSVRASALDIASGETGFQIMESDCAEAAMRLPPDLAVCPECRKDVITPGNRRYRHPFANCTNCGPRFTIVTSVPYDRKCTAMSGFPMCDACNEEFCNPADRRFHAQPIACPDCGPRVTFAGREPAEGGIEGQALDWDQAARMALKSGRILAVKGIGGYHLACDATNAAALRELRARKHRGNRPLAVMARSIEDIARICVVSEKERRLLESPAAPIVILDNGVEGLWPEVSRLGTTGVFLPYTPLHLQLFDDELRYLAMTSMNARSQPLIYRDDEAVAAKGRLWDCMVTHDRPVIRPCDDSVVMVAASAPRVIRRSRGYTPERIAVPAALRRHNVLAIGSEMKNAFCLFSQDGAIMSQHIGEIDSLEAVDRLRECVTDFLGLFRFKPDAVAVDSHPQYESARAGREIAAQMRLPVVLVQHHHAHMCAAMLEAGLDEPCVGVIADSTGFGDDGAIWGCEVLVGGYAGFGRKCYLKYTAMPGPKAVRSPLWSAIAFLREAGVGTGEDSLRQLMPQAPAEEIAAGLAMLSTGRNCYLSSSAGRLLDAAAAILGLCYENSYEGEAAALLDSVAVQAHEPYVYHLNEADLDMLPAVRALASDVMEGVRPGVGAGRFMLTLARALCDAAVREARCSNLKHVIFSGGVFQSRRLLEMCREMVGRAGLEFHSNSLVPCNDGGLSLGQAAVAAEMIKRGRKACASEPSHV